MRILVETRRRAIYLSGVILLLLMSLCGRTFAEDEEILPGRTEEPSDGCVWIGTYGTYCGDAEAVLARINEIRLEACREGFPNPATNGATQLSIDDYVPIKWSTSLEETARIRASEALFVFGHERHNGLSIWTADGGVTSYGEVIAWNGSRNMVPGVNQWYGEKADWLKEVAGLEHGVTGHYTAMIDPTNTYVGVGGFYSLNGYGNATVGRFSKSNAALSQDFLPVYTGYQKVDVLKSYLSTYSLNMPSQIGVGDSREIITNVVFRRDNTNYNVRYLSSLQYSSDNTSVASVDATGHILGRKAGTANITVSLNGTQIGTGTVTVVSGYNISEASVTFSPSRFQYDGTAKIPTVTVTFDGGKLTQGTDYTVSFANNTLVGTATATITGKGHYSGTITAEYTIYCDHDYTYGELNSDNQLPADCSICGVHSLINVPTSITVFMRNSETTDSFYYSYVPLSNPIGSKIGFLLRNGNGDAGYNDYLVSWTPATALSGPSEIRMDYSVYYQVLESGPVTITLTSKWNPAYKRTFTAMLGDLDITKATVSFSQETREYTGSEINNAPTVRWGSRALSSSTDYTVTYRNNVNPGTATVTITGTGDFSGTIEKTFQIVPKTISGACQYRDVSALISEKLTMRFRLYPVPSRYSSYPDVDPYVEFSIDGKVRCRQYLKDAETTVLSGRTYYIVDCPINIKELSDTVTITFYASECVKDGNPQTYSVKTYCQMLLNGTYSEQEKALAKALLTYSAYAREYFNYKTAELTAEDKPNTLSSKQTVKKAISGKISVSGSSQHATYEGISLVLLAETGMRFYITPDASILAGDNRFKTNNSGQYYIAVADAKLGNLDAKKTVKVDGLTVSASPLHYIKSVLQYSTNTKLINLCLAMYDCYTAAKAYQGQ
ncbi:MAG: hypothetical protein J5845_04930 [Lachnospiraceae bacterium]|nr:hypothetical protein [Lachnospiraceae bacterium]